MPDPPVHPRTHGEHLEVTTGAFFTAGSSPHTRGTYEQIEQEVVEVGSSPHTRGTFRVLVQRLVDKRFIPAHTGNIRRHPMIFLTCAVHPRTHGEHLNTGGLSRCLYGSSPHTRGTFDLHLQEGGEDRFIPAHTGNISISGGIGQGASVHPRTHGEHAA